MFKNGFQFTSASSSRSRVTGCLAAIAMSAALVGHVRADGIPSLQITSPNGGEVIPAGSNLLITWTSANAAGPVMIYLLKDGYVYRNLGQAPVSDGHFNYSICDSMGDGSDYTIEITLMNQNFVRDQSDSTFQIVGSSPIPSLHLLSPNGGEALQVGTRYTITWSSTNPSEDVAISLMQHGSPVASIGRVSMAEGRFDWDICPTIQPGDGFTIVIYSVDCSQFGRVGDISDAPFQIAESSQAMPSVHLLSPNGGELFTAGSAATILWSSENPSGDINLILVKGNLPMALIGTVPMAAGRIDCQIPESTASGSDYLIYLASAQAPMNACPLMVSDFSDSQFTIQALVSPALPTGETNLSDDPGADSSSPANAAAQLSDSNSGQPAQSQVPACQASLCGVCAANAMVASFSGLIGMGLLQRRRLA